MIQVEALTLCNDRPVPSEPQAFKCTQDLPGGAGHTTWFVNVLDAQQPLPATCASIKIAANSGDERAKMQGTRG